MLDATVGFDRADETTRGSEGHIPRSYGGRSATPAWAM